MPQFTCDYLPPLQAASYRPPGPPATPATASYYPLMRVVEGHRCGGQAVRQVQSHARPQERGTPRSSASSGDGGHRGGSGSERRGARELMQWAVISRIFFSAFHWLRFRLASSFLHKFFIQAIHASIPSPISLKVIRCSSLHIASPLRLSLLPIH